MPMHLTRNLLSVIVSELLRLSQPDTRGAQARFTPHATRVSVPAAFPDVSRGGCGVNAACRARSAMTPPPPAARR